MEYFNIDDKLALIVVGDPAELYESAKGIIAIANGKFGNRSKGQNIESIKDGKTSLFFLGVYGKESLMCNRAYIHYEFAQEKSSKEAKEIARNHYERIKAFIHGLSSNNKAVYGQ
jgi:hypothetical protein